MTCRCRPSLIGVDGDFCGGIRADRRRSGEIQGSGGLGAAELQAPEPHGPHRIGRELVLI